MKRDAALLERLEALEEELAGRFRELDRTAERNQWKVIAAFQRHRVSDYHFAGSTGYGYNDTGREALDRVAADVFGAEAALVRPHFASGTHTIAAALYGVLRPGDKLLYLTGEPYDTLHGVIGRAGDGTGSLADWGIRYEAVPLLPDGGVDWQAAERALAPDVKVVGIQRSRGYSWRRSFSVDEIGEMAARVKRLLPGAVVFVDNCYGEFAEEREPTEAGADLMAGSLIKNPGGGLAPTGGYIAGRADLVELAANRLFAPGIGLEVGAMLDTPRALFQGLYLAPHTVGQALKGAVLASALLERMGFETSPRWPEPRTDIIQAVKFGDADKLIAFVQGVQAAAAVDAHVTPVPSDMPGYDHQVIMAAGTFMQGGSLELSADAPLREPYIAYWQGGLTYAHAKLGLLKAVERLETLMSS